MSEKPIEYGRIRSWSREEYFPEWARADWRDQFDDDGDYVPVVVFTWRGDFQVKPWDAKVHVK